MNTNLKELVGGMCGTGLSAIGTITQTNEVLQTISLIVTILGAVISCIVIPVVNWYRKAKEDGKITADEISEGINIVGDGITKIDDALDKTKKGDK